MAGLKRKDSPASKLPGGHIYKKPKKEKSQSKKSNPPVQILETETDSEPIVESDTTENSGEDDGISWPSDEDEMVVEVSSNTKKVPVEIPTELLKREETPVKKLVTSNANTCKIFKTT